MVGADGSIDSSPLMISFPVSCSFVLLAGLPSAERTRPYARAREAEQKAEHKSRAESRAESRSRKQKQKAEVRQANLEGTLSGITKSQTNIVPGSFSGFVGHYR